MGIVRASTVSWLAVAVIFGADFGASVCHLDNYVSSCILNILEEHIEATAIINHCHLPLDITFLITYQYKNSTRHNWKYTFVTSNQNERVLIPGLLLPLAPHAPVFLYARVPEKEFKMHNSSFVAIEASFIAVLSSEKWEEAEFLNHTVYIPTTNDCRFSKVGQDPIPWIIGGLFIVALVSGALGGGCYLYRKKKLEVDQLALVSAMEVGLPGAQPYQIDAAVEKHTQNVEVSKIETPQSGTDKEDDIDSSDQVSEQIGQQNYEECEEQLRNGSKGFKFGRLKEETVDVCNDPTELRDTSVVIGNPAYQDKSKQSQELEVKIKESQKQPVNVDPIIKDQHIIANSNIDRTFSEESKLETPLQDSSSIQDNSCIIMNQEDPEDEVLQVNGHPLEREDSLDDTEQVGQGARRKVRGMSSSITDSSTLVSAESSDVIDSQKCL
ncbi:uncharacterized protein [Panulirus ornatus]|uniref:uncharacterized protein isoform X1 n=1 Tax=Panulirus ornatus TaxID=150431 RepID=UPI003A884B42